MTIPRISSKHLHTILRLSIGCIFIVILIRIIDIRLFAEALRQVRIDIVVLAILLYFINIAIRAFRWMWIFNKDEQRISFKNAYTMTLIGVALNVFIPATLGDVVKAYYGYRIYGIKEEMLSVSIVDKIFALASLFLIGSISGLTLGYTLLGGVSLGFAILTCVPAFFPQLIPWKFANTVLRRFRTSLDIEKLLTSFTLSASMKIFVFAMSLGAWVWTCFYFYVLCSAFPVKVNLGYIIVMMPAVTIVRLFPFTVNALGPTEVAVAYFFSKIGINATLAVLISLVSNMISSVLPGGIGLVIILLYGHTVKKKKRQEHKISLS